MVFRLFLLSFFFIKFLFFLTGCTPNAEKGQKEPVKKYTGPRWDSTNFTVWWHDFDSQDQAKKSADRLIQSGAKSVTLVVTEYIDNPRAANIGPTKQTADYEQLRGLIQHFHKSGVRVNLKPHVDAKDSSFRGDFEPEWSEFFKNYRNFIAKYARLAAEEKVDLFTIGTELSSSHSQKDEWEKTINKIEETYKGPLTYAADWKAYKTFPHWDKLDFLGIDSYFPLSKNENPGLIELYEGWQPHIKEIEKWQAKWKKPFIFTEIGFRDSKNAAKEPWEWGKDYQQDKQLQKRLYDATYLAFQDKPYLAGSSYWNWEANPKDPGQGQGFDVRGKPAEKTLMAQFQNKAKKESGELGGLLESYHQEKSRSKKKELAGKIQAAYKRYNDSLSQIKLLPKVKSSSQGSERKELYKRWLKAQERYKLLIKAGKKSSAQKALMDAKALEAKLKALR
ncbi:hypothetical protein ACFL35_09910 [Candidatus Riflebacteria bacterium]